MSPVQRAQPPQLITGATGAALLELASRVLRDTSTDGTWLVSGQRLAANRLLYRVLADAQDPCLAGVERGTLFQCALRIALPKLAENGSVPATRLGIEAGILRALRVGEPSLTELAPLAATRGLPQRLTGTLRELREQQIEADELRSASPTGADLALLLDRYVGGLAEAGIGDRVVVYETAIDSLRAGMEAPLRRMVAFEQPLRTSIEERFIAALANANVECAAVLIATDRASVERYRRAWTVEEDRHQPSEPTSDLEHLCGGLFAQRSERRSDTEDGSVQILAAPGEEREAVEVVRRIQQSTAKNAVYDRTGIVLRNPGVYQPVFEEAFSRADIPAWFSRGSLRPDPTGRAFLALLSCRAENYSATRFAEYLSLGEVPVEAPAEDEILMDGTPTWHASQDPSVSVGDSGEAQLSLDFTSQTPAPQTPAPTRTTAPSFPRRWEHLLVEASVIGGYERWRDRLGGLEHELETRLEHVRRDDDASARGIQARLDQVRNLQRFALPLIERLSALPEEADVGEWIPLLEGLARRSLRRPQRVLSLLADLRPMADVGAMRFGEVRRLLEQRLGELRLEPEGTPFGKVFVGTPEEFRGLDFDTVFVCGMAEGIFPRRVREDPLLLDQARAGLGSQMVDNDQRIEEERLRLRVAVAAATTNLVISYPTWDGLTGRARVPSFYAFDTVAAAWGRIEPLTRISARSPVEDDPGLAIDPAEFDVATVKPFLGGSDSEPGRCNYLLDSSPHLARSLRTRGRRWLNFLGPADGLVVEPESQDTLDSLQLHRLRHRSYSPTSLQHYAACPYRFYLQALLRLRPREKAVDLEQLDPLTRGSLYHEIQFAFLRELAEEQALDFTEEREVTLLERLDRSIESVAGRYAERLRPALPAVYRGEVDDLRTDLRGWLRQVIADPDYTPRLFELAFGLPTDDDHDPASSNDPVLILDRLLAKGSIDMVERAEDDVYRVTDHKTGKARDTRSLTVGGGEALQPLVYAHAAAELLAAEVRSGRLWYSTRRGGYQSLNVPTGDYQRQSLETVIATIDDSVGSGFFPAAPREKACTWCDYRTVCGPHEELRIGIKMKNPETRERLADLIHVRGME